MESMRDWSTLLHDLLVEVVIRVLYVEDFMAFRGVCTSWRAAARKGEFLKSWPRVPLLMLSEREGSNDREFYSLSKGKICMRLSLPEAKGRVLIEARFGWFLTIAASGELNLLNPLSRQQIELPSHASFPEFEINKGIGFILRAVLSRNPSDTPDFALVVVHSGGRYLGCWRPNDKTWTRLELKRGGALHDVNYFNGKFYAINSAGKIWAWDVSGSDLQVAKMILTIDRDLLMFRYAYLVESSAGDLLVILRDGYQYADDGNYGVSNFIVVKLDVMKSQWERITSLGDDAIFIGYNASFSVVSSIFPDMVKPNCIYFSDDCVEAYFGKDMGGGKDMGVYNLEDEKIERFNVESFSLICPPLWIVPSF